MTRPNCQLANNCGCPPVALLRTRVSYPSGTLTMQAQYACRECLVALGYETTVRTREEHLYHGVKYSAEVIPLAWLATARALGAALTKPSIKDLRKSLAAPLRAQ